MPLAMAPFRVGQSADGSVADTMRAFAPLLIAAWMAGICEAGVAWVPLVSVPVAPSVLSAASAPPVFTLSAVVKYGLPRFLGMTKTFRPVFSPPAAAVGDEPLDVVLPDELHAASTEDATRSTAGTHSTRFMERLILNPFNPERTDTTGMGRLEVCGPCGGRRARPGVVAGTRASFMTCPYRRRRAEAPGPEPFARPSHDRSRGGHEHADEQERAGDDAGGLLVEVGQQQGVLQAGERQHREHHTDDRALAAEDGHPGEQHDGDHGQFHADAVVLHRGGEPEGPQHPRHRADDAGDDEQQELDPLD